MYILHIALNAKLFPLKLQIVYMQLYINEGRETYKDFVLVRIVNDKTWYTT